MRKALLQQIETAGLASDATLLVAVSGGIDSVVLLDLLQQLRAEHGLALQVAHLDHQMRPESPADAEFVRQLSASLDIPFHTESEDVPARARIHKVSLEMAGREARREFLQRVAQTIGASLIALAHHRDDQVETFLQRLLRGSGTTGLAAMRPLQDPWWRPLLQCSRRQIAAYAQRYQLDWVEDDTNSDLSYLRNRLRHQLLPQLRELNPQLDARWAELCRQLQDEEEFWQQQVATLLPTLLRGHGDGLRLDRPALLALPRALRGRILRAALARLRGDLYRLEAVHLGAIEELLQGERSQAQLDLPGCWVGRRYQQLWLRDTAPEILADYHLQLPVPGELELPCGRVVRTCLQDEQQAESALCAEFAVAELSFPLVIRNWRAGDVFAPQGMAASKRLKRFFSDQKVELEERRRVPLLVSGEKILWLLGQRRSRHACVTGKSGPILRLELV